MSLPEALAGEMYGYLTTVGRVTGKPHEIEIWFATQDNVLYFLSGAGDGADWVRNLRKSPSVGVRIGQRELSGSARVVAPESDEEALARQLLLAKYQPAYGGDLSQWGATALPVAVDLDRPERT